MSGNIGTKLMIHAEKKHARPQSSSVTQHGAGMRIFVVPWEPR